MGGSDYSESLYKSRIDHHTRTHTSVFTHDSAVKSGKVSKVHEKLDPSKLNSAGKNVRESFDSDAHPYSRAIGVLFDVTGSMGSVPTAFVKKLATLMAGLVKEGFLADPQIMFGMIGDATCDKYPLQVGQFESGNEMDEALSLGILEGGGGGQTTESYELAMYYLARHTDMDCLNKRGLKGYLFLSGDERPYEFVKRGEVKRIIGDDIPEDILLQTILEELQEKFEVFWIYPKQGSYASYKSVIDPLQKMFGQNFLWLDDANDVCELIISHIAAAEGFNLLDIRAGLAHVGSDAGTIDRVSKAVAKWTAPVNSKVAVASSKISVDSKHSVGRL